MQIFKKRLSVHRTSRNLRSLWDEYALEITAEGRERESSRLLALSSFMDSVFDAGQPLQQNSLPFNIDDTVVVVTGLLNVARRASLQLLTNSEDSSTMEEVDRATLAKALSKALTVAKLCLREDLNHQVPHIVSLVLAILESVTSIDDKVLSLQILGRVLRSEESRRELSRLRGLRLVESMASLQIPVLDRQIVLILHLCLTPPSSSLEQRTSFYASQQQTLSTNSERTRLSRSATMDSCHHHSSADFQSVGSYDLHSLHTGSSSDLGETEGVGCLAQTLGQEQGLAKEAQGPIPSWPPLSPLHPFPIERPGHNILTDSGAPLSGEVHYPSASLAAKGVNMAVNVVNEVLRCVLSELKYEIEDKMLLPILLSLQTNPYGIIALVGGIGRYEERE